MKTIKLLVAMLALCVATTASAQLTKEQLKARKEMKKASRAELNEKASKAARKEAKTLKKEGWKANPGALPLDKQLDRSYMMQNDYDEDMFPKYIMGEARSVGENYDGAKMQAMELAKQNLAGQIQTEVTALIESNVANKQMSAEDAATVTNSVMSSKALISQSITRTMPVVEVYRELPNKNKEVLVRLAYSSKLAKEAAKQAIREDLEKQGQTQQDKLDKMLGW